MAMKVLKIYGTYYGKRRLSWTGFEDYLHHEFVYIAPGKVKRRHPSDDLGWAVIYTVE